MLPVAPLRCGGVVGRDFGVVGAKRAVPQWTRLSSKKLLVSSALGGGRGRLGLDGVGAGRWRCGRVRQDLLLLWRGCDRSLVKIVAVAAAVAAVGGLVHRVECAPPRSLA